MGGLIALLVLIGYAYSAISLIGVRQFIPMALNSAIGFAVLSIGILHARPRRGLMAAVTSRAPARHGAAAAPGGDRHPRGRRVGGVAAGPVGGRGRPGHGAVALRRGEHRDLHGTHLVGRGSLNRMDRKRRRAERRLGVQYTASCVLAESPQLADAVPKILEAVCESLGWEVGAMWRVDPEAGVLRCSDVWRALHPRWRNSWPMPADPLRPRRRPARPRLGERPAGLDPDVVPDANFPRARPRPARACTRLRLPDRRRQRHPGRHRGLQRRDPAAREDLLRMLAAVGSQIGQFIERKQAEEEVLQERYLLNSLMDTLPDSVYFKDIESRFLRINKALAGRLGLGVPAEAVGKADIDFFTEEHAHPAREDERAIIETGQPIVGKLEKETRGDDSVAWVSTTKMPMRDAEGRIVGTFGVSPTSPRGRPPRRPCAWARNASGRWSRRRRRSSGPRRPPASSRRSSPGGAPSPARPSSSSRAGAGSTRSIPTTGRTPPASGRPLSPPGRSTRSSTGCGGTTASTAHARAGGPHPR